MPMKPMASEFRGVVWYFLSILMLSLTLFGCDENDHTNLKKYVREINKRAGEEIEPIPEFKQQPSVLYRKNKNRTPFSEQKLVPLNRINKPDRNRKKEPLEFFNLSELKIVGILKQRDKRWGLIKAVDAAPIYKVEKGSHLGKNYGEVEEVKDDGLLIVEKIQESGSIWVDRKRVLKLSKGEE